jgi:hypothetical protein
MSNSAVPVDRYDARESGRAVQTAQNNVMEVGATATLALIRELLKSLKLPEKPVSIEIAIDDSVAYKTNTQAGQSLEGSTEDRALSEQQLRYVREVVQLPQSDEPAVATIPLDRDVTIAVDGKEVFRLKGGIVEKNLLVPTLEPVRESPLQQEGEPAPKEENIVPSDRLELIAEDSSELAEQLSTPAVVTDRESENAVPESEVEIVAEDSPVLPPTNVALSDEQRQNLEKLGVNPQTVENALGQKDRGTVPIIVVLNQEVDRHVPRSQLKNNLQSIHSRLKNVVKDFSRKISSFLGATRDKLFPTTERAIKQDLQNLAVINFAARLLDRFGSQASDRKQVFEGNSFRLERQDNNVTVIAKDGRDTIVSLKDGQLSGSLSQKDVEKFQAVDRQLNQGRSRQFQAEMG